MAQKAKESSTRIELVGSSGHGGVSSTDVVSRGIRPSRSLLVTVAVVSVAALIGWAATTLLIETRGDTGGFALPHPGSVGYELAAAFDDRDKPVADPRAGPIVQAFGPVDSDDRWAEAFLLQRSDTTSGSGPSGEVVEVDGVELLVDATGPATAVHGQRGGGSFTVASARLERTELVHIATLVAGSTSDAVPGHVLLHEGRIQDFTVRRVLSSAGVPGTAGIIYESTDESRSDVLVSWAPADESSLWAPTVWSPSMTRTAADGRELVASGAGSSPVIEVSWLQDELLVQVAAARDFPGGLDGLVDVASAIRPIPPEEFNSILETDRGSVQLHFQASVRERTTGSGSAVGRLTADVDGVGVVVTAQEQTPHAYRLQLRREGSGGAVTVPLRSLDVTAVARIDLSRDDTRGPTVLAGLAPSDLVDLSVTEARDGAPVATVGPLEKVEVPGTDRVLFLVAATDLLADRPLEVVLHHDGDRTRYRL